MNTDLPVSGTETSAFETEFARYTETVRAAVPEGDAVKFVLSAFVGKGDEVIMTPLVPHDVLATLGELGAVPVFADAEPLGLTIDAESALKKAQERTPKTKALYAVHRSGQSAELEKIAPELRARGIALIEDCRGAPGAWRRVGDRLIRCGSWGAALHSLDGACIVTAESGETAEGLTMPTLTGKRVSPSRAAALRTSLRRRDEEIEERRRIADRYRMLFAERELLPFVTRPRTLENNYHVYTSYVIRAQRRDGLCEALAEQGIGSRRLSSAPSEGCPVCARATAECLALPIRPGLTMEEQQRIADALARFYSTGL